MGKQNEKFHRHDLEIHVTYNSGNAGIPMHYVVANVPMHSGINATEWAERLTCKLNAHPAVVELLKEMSPNHNKNGVVDWVIIVEKAESLLKLLGGE